MKLSKIINLLQEQIKLYGDCEVNISIEKLCNPTTIHRWWYSNIEKNNRLRHAERECACATKYEVYVAGKWVEYTDLTYSPNDCHPYYDAVLIAESYDKLPMRAE